MLIKCRLKLLIEARFTNYNLTGTQCPNPLAYRQQKLQSLSYYLQATAIDC